ncbi:COG3942 and LysM peptidoglycan-binding domain-containing protein [Furfurilactobacillus siliginis]|uniref:LysM peptidoglycan-binding domain-containing protein n=1 Tax=Furfurilactobacillus siliginis TaxID=348151 RepID=A0A0R2L2G1_9LACO|nr:LysM peptidoglycan-binding domain-containing protein [Furfurilactobacillus siliginis]KRN95745.1 hypothetical protein IV55_GL001847 [Furfurilactobacillus siliginis]GEK27993.1 hypothetical protein LSI01_03040 [Furfurilactobacillus siliginis]
MKKTIKNVLLTTAGAASVLAGASVAANASTVKSIKGDTIWAFAQKNHTTVDAIVQANHISNANLIYVGQSLVIPDANDAATSDNASQASEAPASATSEASEAASAATVNADGDYTVVAGDTLSSVSAKTGVSIADLASNNSISDINFLLVGQVLHTQATASQAPASQASEASQAPASAASQAPASEAATSVASQAPASQAAPAAPSQAAPAAPAQQAPAAPAAVVGGAGAGIAGFNSGVDGYPAGQCTAFVAGILRSAGVPASKYAYLGNGNAWGANAAARGIAVNQAPSAGSVAYFGYMHVAYVTGVNGDGSVNIIEGNFNGLAYHARTISAGEAAGYIHF